MAESVNHAELLYYMYDTHTHAFKYLESCETRLLIRLKGCLLFRWARTQRDTLWI